MKNCTKLNKKAKNRLVVNSREKLLFFPIFHFRFSDEDDRLDNTNRRGSIPIGRPPEGTGLLNTNVLFIVQKFSASLF